ncbi:hypothetical protein BC628DRAFT_1413253 [Trametes gibbosa]|nr:hypothetical protein BC628DRAFT_1413253 [Trametes gibbosa]
MATQCGHIYCLDCATFHFSQADPFCAVCRKPQTLDNMVRLYLDDDEECVRGSAGEENQEGGMGSSPVSVMCIERAGEDAAATMKRAIAGREDMQDALLACNTFVNSVTPRERPHINQELLHDIAFQLTLVQTVLKDNDAQVTRLEKEVHAAKAKETQARTQAEEQRRLLRRAEKELTAASKKWDAQREAYELLYQQCIVATEDASRQRVRAAKAENQTEEFAEETKQWRERYTKATKKYYVLKNELKQLKQAAQGRSRHTQPRTTGSDDLEIVQ